MLDELPTHVKVLIEVLQCCSPAVMRLWTSYYSTTGNKPGCIEAKELERYAHFRF
jgi:hypothetical protein